MKALALAMTMMCMAGIAEAMEPFVRGSQQAIESAHGGRPFVLSLWSLDCVHCRDDLALLGKLGAKYPALPVVLVATDTPERLDDLQGVLARYRLGGVSSWVFADSFVERLRYEVDPKWFGELPRTYFYDANGKRTAVSGKLDEREVEEWIKTVSAAR